MNPRELAKLRKDFDQRYTIDYPPPKPNTANEQGQNNNVVMIIWLIVSLAGAGISLPHTVNAVVVTANLTEMWQKTAYGIAVFVGVELALIMVAFTLAHRQIENPQPRPVITIATLLASLLYRLGLRHRPTPPTADNHGGTGGLLAILLMSAVLFNMADTTKVGFLLDATKIVSGLIAPALLFLAGHEFAHHLARRLLSTKIAQRESLEAHALWQARRDEAWRNHAQTITDKSVEVTTKDPLATHTQMNLLDTLVADTDANVFTKMPDTAPVNGTGGNMQYLMIKKD